MPVASHTRAVILTIREHPSHAAPCAATARGAQHCTVDCSLRPWRGLGGIQRGPAILSLKIVFPAHWRRLVGPWTSEIPDDKTSLSRIFCTRCGRQCGVPPLRKAETNTTLAGSALVPLRVSPEPSVLASQRIWPPTKGKVMPYPLCSPRFPVTIRFGPCSIPSTRTAGSSLCPRVKPGSPDQQLSTFRSWQRGGWGCSMARSISLAKLSCPQCSRQTHPLDHHYSPRMLTRCSWLPQL